MFGEAVGKFEFPTNLPKFKPNQVPQLLKTAQELFLVMSEEMADEEAEAQQPAWVPEGMHGVAKAQIAVKLPSSIAELKKQAEQERHVQPEEQSSSLTCLVCKSVPVEYIALPACRQAHIYCVPCAVKMLDGNATPNPRFPIPYGARVNKQRGKGVRCVLCSKLSLLDADGIRGLRRLNRPKQVPRGEVCAAHGLHFDSFCMQTLTLLCANCDRKSLAASNIKPIEEASNAINVQLSETIGKLEQKQEGWKKLAEFALEEQPRLAAQHDERAKEARQAFEELRKELASREEQYIAQIRSFYEKKRQRVEDDASASQQHLQNIELARETALATLSSPTSLTRITGYMEHEELQRSESFAPVPASHAIELPRTEVLAFTRALQRMQYPLQRFYGEFDEAEFDPEEEPPF